MGISKFSLCLNALEKKHVSVLGKRLAIDANSWLRSAFRDSAEEILGHKKKLIEADTYLYSLVERVKALQKIGKEPVLYLDGGKSSNKLQYPEEKEDKLKKALDAYKELVQLRKSPKAEKNDPNPKLKEKVVDGKTEDKSINDAERKMKNGFMAGVTIDFDILQRIHMFLSAHGIRSELALYEADPQIVSLFRDDKIDGVISDDCDFIFYGVDKMLINYNSFNMKGIYYKRRKLAKLERTEQKNGLKTISRGLHIKDLAYLDDDQLLNLLVLLGSDYTESGVRLARPKILKFLQSSNSFEEVLEKVEDGLAAVNLPFDNVEEYKKAKWVLRHNRIYKENYGNREANWICRHSMIKREEPTEEGDDYDSNKAKWFLRRHNGFYKEDCEKNNVIMSYLEVPSDEEWDLQLFGKEIPSEEVAEIRNFKRIPYQFPTPRKIWEILEDNEYMY